MLAGLGCVGVGSWSSRGLDNGLRVGVNYVGGFYHDLKMSELFSGRYIDSWSTSGKTA